jgi:hypothetical protein
MLLKNLFYRIVCCFVIVLFFTRLSAQTTNPTPQFALRTDLIPPSPNAASLGKYGTVPVSLQTGIPDISIPITTVVGKQLKLPVTLNYHNNGFKPSEEASWVGLGWSLDAGGVITRIVKDKVDGDVNIGPNGQYDAVDWRFHQPDSITQDFMDHVMWNQSFDTEPDIYAFNFAGYTGKFLVYKGRVYQYPYQRLTIIKETAVDGFTIVTPEGTAYRFWNPESTVTVLNPFFNPDRPSYNVPNPFTSSWYLQSVTSADLKDVITLTYDSPQTIAQQGPANQTLTVDITYPLRSYSLSPFQTQIPVRIQSIRLTRITTSKMRVDFNQSATSRQDLATKALDNIKVYNYQGELINNFQFKLDYFNNASTSGGVDNKRLKLTGGRRGPQLGEAQETFLFL